jgi:hypothetical protein
MYGPNYVKLSRVFAVQLFSMIFEHSATPGPIRPPLVPQPCHHRLHSPRPHPCTATHTARDSDLGSANHDMSRLSILAYLNDAPIHGLIDIPLAYFQPILVVAPSPLAPRPHTATHTTRDSNLGNKAFLPLLSPNVSACSVVKRLVVSEGREELTTKAASCC